MWSDYKVEKHARVIEKPRAPTRFEAKAWEDNKVFPKNGEQNVTH